MAKDKDKDKAALDGSALVHADQLAALAGDVDQLRKSSSDAIERLTNQHEDLEREVGVMAETFNTTLAAIEAQQATVRETLSNLSSEYAEVAKHHVTDWRDLAGEKYVKAEAASLDATRNRRELMKKLAKYEQDVTYANVRGMDPKYTQLCADCNAAANAVAKTRRKATEIKDEAMAAIAI